MSELFNEGLTEACVGAISLFLAYLSHNKYIKVIKFVNVIINASSKQIKDLNVGDFVKVKGKTYSPSPLVSPWKSVLCSSYLYQKGRNYEQKIKTKSVTETSNEQTTDSKTEQANVDSKTKNETKIKSQETVEKEKWEKGIDVEVKDEKEVDLYLKDDTGEVLIYKPYEATDYTLTKVDNLHTLYKVNETSNTSKRFLSEFEEEYAFMLDQIITIYGKVSLMDEKLIIRKAEDLPFLITKRPQDEIIEDLQSRYTGLYLSSVIFGIISAGLFARSGYVFYKYFRK